MVIYNDHGIPASILVNPRGIVCCQVDTSVAAIEIVGRIAARISMRELCVGAEALNVTEFLPRIQVSHLNLAENCVNMARNCVT